MKPEIIERVFGHGRVKMATGEHVEVFREAVTGSERRTYTKRFLETGDADFRQWTDREWRILARLIGHGVRCVPDVVQYHGGAGGVRQLQTYDAGISVDQWATLLPVSRGGRIRRHVFEDCAHWWALAHYCLAALDEIHALHVVHLDLKADNICIPFGPSGFDPESTADSLHLVFGRLALIDFAFSLVSRDNLTTPLPIGWEKDYDYQSPRLLGALEAGRAGDVVPTLELDWRCDLYSLAAMLRKYLSDDRGEGDGAEQGGWTRERRDDARALVYRLRACHDSESAQARPHHALMELTGRHVAAPDLAQSLAAGWDLAPDSNGVAPGWVTPMTRVIAGSLSPTCLTVVRAPAGAPADSDPVPAVFRTPRPLAAASIPEIDAPRVIARARRSRAGLAGIASVGAAISVAAAAWVLNDPTASLAEKLGEAVAMLGSRYAFDREPPLGRTENPGVPGLREREARTEVAGTKVDPTPASPEAPSKTRADSMEGRQDAADSKAAAPGPTQPETLVSEGAAPRASPLDRAPGTSESLPAADAVRKDAETMASVGLPPPLQPRRGAPARSAQAARPAPEVTTRTQVARSPAPPAAAQSRGASVASANQARPHPSASVQAAKVARPAAASYPYDPVAARQATAHLTMLATRVPSAADTTTGAPPAASAAQERSARPGLPVAPSAPTAASALALAPSTAPDGSSSAPLKASPASRPAATAPEVAATPAPEASAAERRNPRAAPRPASPPAGFAGTSPADALRAGLTDLLKFLGLAHQRAAPIEDQGMRADRSSSAPERPKVDAPESDRRTSSVAQAPSNAAPQSSAGVRSPVPTSEAELSSLARRMLANTVPHVAAQARADASQVLTMASLAEHPLQQRYLIDAMRVPWRSEQAYPPAATSSRARPLYDMARYAFASGRKVDALELQLRAFAADPRDPDVSGFLAFLYLDVSPAQPETARQLALHALAFSGPRRSARFDDWNTLAVASALTGRDDDATRAFFIELAVSGDADRTCRAAWRAYTVFGERLRGPVDALSHRIRSGPEPWACTAMAWTAAR